MASPEKVKEYFEKSQILAITSSAKEMMFSRMYIELLKEGDENAGEYCEFEKRKNELLTQKTFSFMSEFFEKNFTDGEMDELIAIYSSPIFKRIVVILPDLITNLLDHMAEHEKEIEEEIRSIRAQIKEEYRILAGATDEIEN